MDSLSESDPYAQVYLLENKVQGKTFGTHFIDLNSVVCVDIMTIFLNTWFYKRLRYLLSHLYVIVQPSEIL